MDVPNNETVPEGLHSIAEDVATDSLDDILHEICTVGFDPLPFFVGPIPSYVTDSPPN